VRILMIPKPEPADAVTSGIGRYVGILEKHFGSDVEIVHLPGAPHEEDRPAKTGEKRDYVVVEGRVHKTIGMLQRVVPSSCFLLFGYLRETVRLARKLRPFRGKVDIIHVNRVGCEIQTIAARLAGFRRVVATIHNLPGEEAAAQHWLRCRIEKLSFFCADHLISVSEATYEAWEKRIGLRRDKVTIIHNGIDVRECDLPDKQEARRRLGISDNTIVIGICARLHPMKGHGVLLDAFAKLLRKRRLSGYQVDGVSSSEPVADLLLLIAGDGPEQANIEAKIKELDIADKVRMLGRIQDVMGFMRALDLHVLPSVTLESMPFSVVEAMFAGVPSIVSDVGGAKEVILASGGGQVVHKEDVDALWYGMQDWAYDTLRCNAAGGRCSAYAREKLTGSGMTNATIKVYRQAL